MARIAGETVQIDVPESNRAAMELVAGSGFIQTFGCMRLYRGEEPVLASNRIFAVTSLEFG